MERIAQLERRIKSLEVIQSEVTVWPKDPQEIRLFIDNNFISCQAGDKPDENDKYLLTAHDLLSAFSWWTEFMEQPGRYPIPSPTAAEQSSANALHWLNARLNEAYDIQMFETDGLSIECFMLSGFRSERTTRAIITWRETRDEPVDLERAIKTAMLAPDCADERQADQN